MGTPSSSNTARVRVWGRRTRTYVAAGASIAESAADVFAKADVIVKVKEPLAVERAMLRESQILFTYLHLATDLPQTRELLESGATAIAYETVTNEAGALPLLTPMSQVAGRMSIQAGAHCLETAGGGSGILLGGVPGVNSASVVVIGGGVVGLNAIEMAIGLGADVTVLDRDLRVLNQLSHRFGLLRSKPCTAPELRSTNSSSTPIS